MKRLILSLCVCCSLTVAAVGALEFVSTDRNNDILVAIDSATGAVTPIGPFDQPGEVIRYAWLDGRLYGLMYEAPFLNYRLVEVDPVSGQVVSSVPVMYEGRNIAGESLLVLDGQLHMSGDPEEDTTSQLLLRVDLGGHTTLVADFGGQEESDLDGLVADPGSGSVYNLDHDGTNPPYTKLLAVHLDPPHQELIHLYDSPGLGVADPVFLWGQLFAVCSLPGAVPRLFVIDPVSGTIEESMSLDYQNPLVGLATRPDPSDVSGNSAEWDRGLHLANHPNPIGPRTTFRFQTVAGGSARLAVFDATGRSVATVFRGYLPAGEHRVTWTLDESGFALANGAYVSCLQVGCRVILGKVVILR